MAASLVRAQRVELTGADERREGDRRHLRPREWAQRPGTQLAKQLQRRGRVLEPAEKQHIDVAAGQQRPGVAAVVRLVDVVTVGGQLLGELADRAGPVSATATRIDSGMGTAPFGRVDFRPPGPRDRGRAPSGGESAQGGPRAAAVTRQGGPQARAGAPGLTQRARPPRSPAFRGVRGPVVRLTRRHLSGTIGRRDVAVAGLGRSV